MNCALCAQPADGRYCRDCDGELEAAREAIALWNEQATPDERKLAKFLASVPPEVRVLLASQEMLAAATVWTDLKGVSDRLQVKEAVVELARVSGAQDTREALIALAATAMRAASTIPKKARTQPPGLRLVSS